MIKNALLVPGLSVDVSCFSRGHHNGKCNLATMQLFAASSSIVNIKDYACYGVGGGEVGYHQGFHTRICRFFEIGKF